MIMCPPFAFQKDLVSPDRVQEPVYLQPGMEPFSRCEWHAKSTMKRLKDQPHEWLRQVIDIQNWGPEYREWAPFQSESQFHMSVFICMKLGLYDE